MKRLLSIFLFCSFLIIAFFLLFGNAESWIAGNLNSGKSVFTYSLLSFFVLSSDILLPVPSSLVMILNGKVLGLFGGTFLSLFSGLVSSSVGFFMGRKANPILDKFFSSRDKEYGNNLFDRFGNTAIAISKALPILSEAISLVAGTTSIRFSTFLLYSFLGHFTVSLAYAYVGSFSSTLDSNLIAGLVILTALLATWVLQLTISKNRQAKRYGSGPENRPALDPKIIK